MQYSEIFYLAHPSVDWCILDVSMLLLHLIGWYSTSQNSFSSSREIVRAEFKSILWPHFMIAMVKRWTYLSSAYTPSFIGVRISWPPRIVCLEEEAVSIVRSFSIHFSMSDISWRQGEKDAKILQRRWYINFFARWNINSSPHRQTWRGFVAPVYLSSHREDKTRRSRRISREIPASDCKKKYETQALRYGFMKWYDRDRFLQKAYKAKT